jgi:hypothetical protein
MHFKRTKILFIFTILCGALLGTGCQNVQPWERGNLTDYTMRPDRDSLHKAMKAHVYYTREAASGGQGIGGGGCGCN